MASSSMFPEPQSKATISSTWALGLRRVRFAIPPRFRSTRSLTSETNWWKSNRGTSGAPSPPSSTSAIRKLETTLQSSARATAVGSPIWIDSATPDRLPWGSWKTVCPCMPATSGRSPRASGAPSASSAVSAAYCPTSTWSARRSRIGRVPSWAASTRSRKAGA